MMRLMGKRCDLLFVRYVAMNTLGTLVVLCILCHFETKNGGLYASDFDKG